MPDDEETVTAEEYYKNLEKKTKKQIIETVRKQDQIIAGMQMNQHKLKSDVLSMMRVIKIYCYTHKLRPDLEPDDEVEYVGIPVFDEDNNTTTIKKKSDISYA